VRAETVFRPLECAEYRTPPPPTEAPTPRLDTFNRTPGASFIDLRMRNPVAASSDLTPREAVRALGLLAGDPVFVAVETPVVAHRGVVDPRATPEVRHWCARRLVSRGWTSNAVRVALVQVGAVPIEEWRASGDRWPLDGGTSRRQDHHDRCDETDDPHIPHETQGYAVRAAPSNAASGQGSIEAARKRTTVRTLPKRAAPTSVGSLPSRLDAAPDVARTVTSGPAAGILRHHVRSVSTRVTENVPFTGRFLVGGTGLEPVTPSLSSWCSPN
jgi:hypothetical protein